MAKKRGSKRQVQKSHHTGMLPTNNLFAIIIILFIITSILSSYLTYERSKTVVDELSGKAAAEAKLCVNKQPTINQSCNTTGTIGVGYYCDVDASDPDNDTITFYDNTGLFDIDNATGEIIFTPDAADAGTHSIVLTASDGKGCSNSNATTAFTITIPGLPGPPPGPAGGGGGGGGGVERECTPQWECTRWGPCQPDGKRTRICYTLNNCFVDKPIESADCIYVLPPRPRVPVPEPVLYLCNFDLVDECQADFGAGENWIYTYKQKNSTITVFGVEGEGMDAAVDYSIYFFAPITRIKPLDVTGDGVDDFEYIVHSIEGGKARTTVRLVRQVESVVERPVYIETLPYILVIILMFVYENACTIFLIVLILAAIFLYSAIMRKVEKQREKESEKRKNR